MALTLQQSQPLVDPAELDAEIDKASANSTGPGLVPDEWKSCAVAPGRSNSGRAPRSATLAAELSAHREQLGPLPVVAVGGRSSTPACHALRGQGLGFDRNARRQRRRLRAALGTPDRGEQRRSPASVVTRGGDQRRLRRRPRPPFDSQLLHGLFDVRELVGHRLLASASSRRKFLARLALSELLAQAAERRARPTARRARASRA